MDFIHKFVPAGDSDRKTAFVLLHGTGGNEEDLLSLGHFLNPDAALLGVRGKVLEHGAPRFFRRLAEGVFDEEDLIVRTHELAQFIDEAVIHYHLEDYELIAVGYSNGANIATSMMWLTPHLMQRAVLFRAMIPFVNAPEKRPDLHGKQVLLLSGLHDPLIPPDHVEGLRERFIAYGADVTLELQNAGHGLLPTEFELAKQWLALQ